MTYAKFLNSAYDAANIAKLERLIFFYKYPKFSTFWLIALILFALTFNA